LTILLMTLKMRTAHIGRLCIVPILTLTGLAAAGDLRLIEAVRSKNTEQVRHLLAQAVDVNVSQGDGATALQWAAYLDDVDTADLLIRAGAKVNAADDHGITPLWLACSSGGSAKMVGRLLQADANPNAAHATGETALMTASRTGNLAAVRLLLASHAEVNAREKTRAQTALMWAAAQGHTEVVQSLIAAGADVHARSRARRQLVNTTGNADYTGVMEVEQGGFTPLLFAARGGHLPTARELLAAGADVNDTAADGTSALVTAAHSGHAPLAVLLLEKGADANANGSGYTALHIAVRRGDVEVVKALVSDGADLDARLIKPTPSRRLSDDVALARPLVGTTPLWLAASFGQVGILRILAAGKADPRLTANDGTTPLMAAIGRNQSTALEAVRVLLDAGADVNAADETGNTALHRAASSGFDPIVQLLADRGAKVDIKNKQGQTPLMMTRLRRGREGAIERKTTAELLRGLGAKE
jgi:ankyrin repeat protein